MRPTLLLFILLAISSYAAAADKKAPADEEIVFHMDRYSRDLRADTLKGSGHAWLKKGDREIWADEVEIDYKEKRAIANGNVHIREGDIEFWCRHANYALSGEDATLDEATIVSGQFVVTGAVIRKIDRSNFEVEEGTYTNCNLDYVRDPDVGKCLFDWKIYGKRINITTNDYVRIQDALVYLKRIPIFYTPYFIAPVKSSRQSGFLMPHVVSISGLGSGFQWPYFIALGSWHDLTIDPTYYNLVGYHLGLNYRYVYSPTKQGNVNVYATQWRFSRLDSERTLDPRPDDAFRAATATDAGNPGRHRTLGVIGEWAIAANNQYAFDGRAQTRLDVRLVSDPYYTQYFYTDLGTPQYAASIRSQASFSLPTDEYMLAANVVRHQSMVLSKDFGSDQGPVSQLPTIRASKTNSMLLGQFLSYEIDSRFDNFYRTAHYDPFPATALTAGGRYPGRPTADYQAGDWVRTGQRFNLEPRLVANIPMPPGFQLQPLLSGGTFAYHFDTPRPETLHREYLATEIPISMYLSRKFETGITGFEKVSHVFQPRVVFADSLYQTPDPGHAFFKKDAPRFDINDVIEPYRYTRFELINRFRRKTANGIERFFLLQLSEQYNMVTSKNDPRFLHQRGPIELLTELRVGGLSLQAQANYQLDTVGAAGAEVHEYDWSSALSYTQALDRVTLTTLFRNRQDPALIDQTVTADFYKVLPTFFNVGGMAEYSLRRGELRQYSIGFYFASKPRSCWSIALLTGQDSARHPFANFSFSLQFGDAVTGGRTL